MKNKKFTGKKKRVTLWRWICTRLLSLAIGSIVVVISILWLRYYLPSAWRAEKIPEREREELNRLIENPHADISRYHEIIDKWYGVEFSDPTFDMSDWALVLILILASISVVIYLTLSAVRPVSMHITHLAQVARSVSNGEFGTKVEGPIPVPAELSGLAEDINLMSAKLAVYEKELKVSHIALAHELRSPLTAAIGRLQGMIDGVFIPSAEQHLLVMRQLQHLNHLVDDLSLLSLARADQLHLDIREIAIDDVIREKIAWIRPKLEEMDVIVSFSGERNMKCHADHFRIGQVVSILLDNALKYASEGRKIDVHCYRNKNEICFEVRDYGKGVEDDFLKDIFIRFSRAESSRSRNSGGSGLGLSIAEAICSAHHGRISIIQNCKRGMIFKVCLPLETRRT